MSILVYIEHDTLHVHPYGLQTINAALQFAKSTQQEVYAVAVNTAESIHKALARQGIKKLFCLPSVEWSDSPQVLAAFQQVLSTSKASIFMMIHNDTAKVLAPSLAALNEASLAIACTEIPTVVEGGHLQVNRPIFSGKAIQTLLLTAPLKIISLQANSIEAATDNTADENIELIQMPATERSDYINITASEEKSQGTVSIADADIVVSGGMGLGAADNWHLLEKLAQKMNAALACTRLVSDAGWRPHHEHVGQTGTTIAPQVYIAVGISGAIQHLAGVNQSKIIVAINKDKDAPIFSIADYGIVGDALDILPKMI